jgi:hypothetical protein
MSVWQGWDVLQSLIAHSQESMNSLNKHKRMAEQVGGGGKAGAKRTEEWLWLQVYIGVKEKELVTHVTKQSNITR